MKKLILCAIILLFSASVANATWTFKVNPYRMSKNYLKWSVTLTSDGNALSATDLMSITEMPTRLRALAQGASYLIMKVSPGTGAVIPDNTIDIELENEENDNMWADTAISKDAISWHKLWADIGTYLPVTAKLNLVVNDIGTAGDQVTIYFVCWVENP